MPELSADQFSIEQQGLSPLRYRHWGDIQRLGATHPDVSTPATPTRRGPASEIPNQEYFAPQVTVTMGENKRPLKTPKTIANRGAAKPGTAAFLDYEERGPGEVYVHYMRTRDEYGGRGLGNRLMDTLAAQFPTHTINLGRIESSHVYNMQRRLRGQGRKVTGDDRGFFGS